MSAERCACLDVKEGGASVLCNACNGEEMVDSNISLLSPIVSSAVVQKSKPKRLPTKSRKTSTGKSITALRRTCLRRNFERVNNNNKTKVCSGITGLCTESPGEISFNLTYFDSCTNQEETIPITAKILDTPYSIILGRPDIKKHNILLRIGNHLFVESTKSEPLRAWQTSLKGPVQSRDSNGGSAGSSILNTLYKKEDLLTPEYDDDGLEGDDQPLPWDTEEIAEKRSDHATPGAEVHTLPQVLGSEQFQTKIRTLLVQACL
jgi:hypothetical protein